MYTRVRVRRELYDTGRGSLFLGSGESIHFNYPPEERPSIVTCVARGWCKSGHYSLLFMKLGRTFLLYFSKQFKNHLTKSSAYETLRDFFDFFLLKLYTRNFEISKFWKFLLNLFAITINRNFEKIIIYTSSCNL